MYDLSAGEGPAARLVREVEGHCAEVMSLRRWAREETESGKGRREEWVVSAGLDGTIRKWKVAGECRLGLGSGGGAEEDVGRGSRTRRSKGGEMIADALLFDEIQTCWFLFRRP